MKRASCLAVLLLIGCSGERTTSAGVRYLDVVEGTGPAAQRGDSLEVEYTGTLQDGTEFDFSRRPKTIRLGDIQLISGWNDGLIGVKEGGKRKLWVPPGMGYGAAGRPPKIPGNAELIFEVVVLRVIPKSKSR
jgi:FKBP-type peptidyl-prolyl cis-trans isomerase